MATPIIMPKFGMLQTEATIVRWLRAEGETVEAGDPLLEVETDKVNMEVEAPTSGILAGISARPGQVVPVTVTIGYILQPGEALPAAAPPRRVTPLAARVAAAAGIDIAEVPAADASGRVTRRDVEAHLTKLRATPAARRIARDHQLDLAQVTGAGPRGRIQAADVARAAEQALRLTPHASHFTFDASPTPPIPEPIPLHGIRRTIAARMTESYRNAPHITLTVEADMTAAEALRGELNRFSERQGGPQVSVTALLVKFCAWALLRHPLVNASLLDDVIHLHAQANIGVAVALDDGLIVPVIRAAERLGIAQIAGRLDDLSRRAREGKLTPDDVTGGAFTITNLGMFGVKHFTAIINPPEAAILAVGRIARRPVADERSDEVRVRPMMEMTLSADHRVLDGAVAARFLADVVAALEQPSILLW